MAESHLLHMCIYVPLFGHVKHEDSPVCSLVHIQKCSIQWYLRSILECTIEVS